MSKPRLQVIEHIAENSREFWIYCRDDVGENVTYTIERSEADKDDYQVIAENVAVSGSNTYYTDEN